MKLFHNTLYTSKSAGSGNGDASGLIQGQAQVGLLGLRA